jgi:pimeloyl-ACP methyl ester carboxylesterase
VPPYEITVEFLAGYTNITVIREYGENARVSVVGASAGTTEESIRRAFLEAQVAWMLLQAFPKRPKAAVLEEPPLDSDFLARLARAALEEQS